MGNQKPVFIGTTEGAVVPFNVLETYALKGSGDEKSQRLPTDRFAEGYKSLIPPVYNLETLIYLLEANTWHFKCVDAKAHDVAGLGFEIKENKEGETEGTRNESDKKVLEEFFSTDKLGRPADAIFTDCWTDREATGCLALEVVREDYDGTKPPALMAHLPVHTIRIHKDGNKLQQKRGIKTRWFKMFGYDKDVDKETGQEHPLGSLDAEKRATEVIWDIAFSGRSDFYGMPDVTPALGAIEGSNAARDYNIDFFRNHGIPSYAIYITGDYQLGDLKNKDGEKYDPDNEDHDINDFDYEIIMEAKRHLNTIARNPHAPLIMAVPSSTPEGRVTLEFKPLNVEVKEASFRMTRKDYRDEILVAHGVPGYRVGIVETGSLGQNVAEETSKIYKDSVVNPRKNIFEALINKYIVREGFGIKGWKFKFEPFTVDEKKLLRDLAEFMFARGAMTPNEIREKFGKPFGLERDDSRPELNEYYIDNQPVTKLQQSSEEGFMGAVKSFQSDLLDIAMKSAQGG